MKIKMLHTLGEENSVLNQFILELRDEQIQKDRMRFRKNLERIGYIMAYEISKKLTYVSSEVITPLGSATIPIPRFQPVVCSILRAGLPFHNGILEMFDGAGNGFISAYRKHHKDGTFDIKLEYVSTPDVTGREVILADPMLATGSSMVLAYKALLNKGTPTHTHIATVIASRQGIQHIIQNLGDSVTIWAAAVDEELTAQSYIVPGLGDAGDLAFGEK